MSQQVQLRPKNNKVLTDKETVEIERRLLDLWSTHFPLITLINKIEPIVDALKTYLETNPRGTYSIVDFEQYLRDRDLPSLPAGHVKRELQIHEKNIFVSGR